MGFLDFLKKPETKPETESEQLELDQLQGWFSSSLGPQLSEARKEASSIYSGISKALQEIGTAARTLASTKFKGEERAHVAAKMVKDTIVNRVKSAKLTVPPFEPEHTFLDSFQHKTSKMLNSLLAMSPKQAFLLSRYFGKSSDALVGSIKSAKGQLDSLKTFLDSSGRMLWVQQQFETKTSEHAQLVKEIGALDKKAARLKEEAAKKEKGIEKLKTGLKTFLSSPAWQEFGRLKKEMSQKEAQLDQLKSGLTIDLSSVRRPLKKLSHAGEHALDAFLREPLTFLLETGEEETRQLLEKSLRIIADKNIPLKPAEMKKLQRLINELGTTIPKTKSRYLQLRDELKALKSKDASGLLEEKTSLERQIEQSQQELEELRTELTKAETRQAESAARLGELKKELEKLINQNTEKRVIIKN